MTGPMRLLLATRNAGKLAELQRLLADAVPGVEVVGLRDVPEYPEAPETGATFAENALLKAREAVRYTGLPAVADDSGIAAAALDGRPGVRSARYAGEDATDEENLAKLLREAPAGSAVAYVCALAYVDDDTEHVVEGRCEGTLAGEPRGTNGFGYDPVFLPDGLERTAAELTAAEKDARSHRGQAFAALVPLVAELLGRS